MVYYFISTYAAMSCYRRSDDDTYERYFFRRPSLGSLSSKIPCSCSCVYITATDLIYVHTVDLCVSMLAQWWSDSHTIWHSIPLKWDCQSTYPLRVCSFSHCFPTLKCSKINKVCTNYHIGSSMY